MGGAYSNYSQSKHYRNQHHEKALLLASILLSVAASSAFADALLFTVNATLTIGK